MIKAASIFFFFIYRNKKKKRKKCPLKRTVRHLVKIVRFELERSPGLKKEEERRETDVECIT